MLKVNNRIFFHAVVLLFILSQTGLAAPMNLLENGGFEKSSAILEKENFCQNWPVTFGTRAKQCSAALSTGAYKGKYSLKLILKGTGADVWTGQKIKVIPGMKLNFKLYAKGTPKEKFYIQFVPMIGTKNQESTYIYFPFSPDWRLAAGSYSIPENVDGVRCLIHMVGNPAEGYFDEFELNLSPENTLSNKHVILNINPLIGGGIDGFIDGESHFNYTRSRQPGVVGGMGIDILPGDQYPGVFANALYQNKVIVPYREIRVSHTNGFGNWSGLNISKTYSLPSEDKPEAKIMVEVKNESSRTLSFIYRIQNVISPDDGIFSYPSRDWLTIFDKTPESIRTINSLVLDNLRTGWCAKAYKKHKTLLFRFDNKTVHKIYSCLTKEFDTMEWYYDKISLNPNESWHCEYSISLASPREKPYMGGLKYQSPPVLLKGIKLAPPEKSHTKLPSIIQGYFPYGAALSSVATPESAGSRTDCLLYTHQRQVRELADNYFNNFYVAHMFTNHNLFEYLGEEARLYDMTVTPIVHIVGKNDVDTEKYLAEKWKISTRYNVQNARQSIKKYKDRILCYYTGDEITNQNINCMLLGHDILRQEFDHPDAAFFPYLNLSGTTYEIAKYLPVYLGDLYPVYEAESLTRNPWAAGNAVENAVKNLPDSIIWFMPQAFASGGIYALPAEAEMRLMIYSAVAAGAKGIIVYGLNGTSRWLVKAGGETIPILTAEGAGLPQWKTLGECGRELTAIGPRLFYTKPELDYREVEISCGKISRTSRNIKVYEGPAITVSSLKHQNGKLRYLVVINRDDRGEQTGTVSFPQTSRDYSCYDLTHMKLTTSRELKIALAPGDAAFFVMGNEADLRKEVEQVFTNRFQRERVRYLIASERARKNGIEVPPVPCGEGEKAYRAVIAAQQELQQVLRKSEFGQMLEQWMKIRALLAKANFALIKNFDLIVPPSIQEKTPNFRKHPRPEDPVLRGLLDDIEHDFFNYWKFDRTIENGGYQENRQQIQDLIDRIPGDVQKILDYLGNMKRAGK